MFLTPIILLSMACWAVQTVQMGRFSTLARRLERTTSVFSSSATLRIGALS